MPRPKPPSRVATHEAGHAIYCVAAGITVTRVEVWSRGGLTGGQCCWHGWPSPIQRAALCLAGLVAEKLVFGACRPSNGKIDMDRAAAIATAHAAPGEFGAFLPRALELAEQAIAARLWDVVDLGHELDRLGMLTGQQVAELLKRAG